MSFVENLTITAIGLVAGTIGGAIVRIEKNNQARNELEKQDIRITEAIKRLDERLTDYRSDLKELEREAIATDRELEIKIDESDRRFRSLVNFLASKNLHYRIRDSNKETLS